MCLWEYSKARASGYNCMMNVMLKGESVNSAQAIAATLETRLNDGAESPRVSLVTISFDESGEYALLQIAVNGDEFSGKRRLRCGKSSRAA